MLQTFPEPEVAEVVGAELVAQEGGELLVLFEESIFPVGAEDMMAVLDLLQGGVELAWQAAGEAGAKTFRDLVGGESPEPQLTTELGEAEDWGAAPEDDIATVLDVAERVGAMEVHGH